MVNVQNQVPSAQELKVWHIPQGYLVFSSGNLACVCYFFMKIFSCEHQNGVICSA